MLHGIELPLARIFYFFLCTATLVVYVGIVMAPQGTQRVIATG